MYVNDKRAILIEEFTDKGALPWHLILLADPDKETVNKYISDSRCFVLKSQKEMQGQYMIRPMSGNAMEIMNISVAPGMQGKGYGQRLVEHAILMAKKEGYTNLFVSTGNTSIPALALYKKMGFEIMETYSGYFLEHYPEPIYENGMQCIDRITLKLELT